VFDAPTKSYVVINSIGSDKSIAPTMCDLGRVSRLATAVTLPRTSNIANRSDRTQNTRNTHHRRRPKSVILNSSYTKSLQGNTTELSTNQISANTRVPFGNQSLISSSSNPSTVDYNPDRKPVSISPAKKIKLDSAATNSRMISTTDVSTLNNQNNRSVTVPEKTQMNLSTPHHTTSQSTNLPSRVLTSKPHQVSPQVYEAEVQTNTLLRTHTHNATQIHTEQPAPLPTPGMGSFQNLSSPSVASQIQQQNDHLRSENLILKKQLSLFRQLMQNPQRLNNILSKLDQTAQ